MKRLLLYLTVVGATSLNAADFPPEGHYATSRVNTNILRYFQAHATELGHAADAGAGVYVHYLSGNGFVASAQDFKGGSHKTATVFDPAGPEPWFMNAICVPFNNPEYDVQYGGAHDMDVKTEPGTPITSLVTGTVASITHPIWGWQIGVKLDQPIRGIPYFAYLHLGAVNPALRVGDRVEAGDLIAYSGGANSPEQLNGQTNTPFGPQFINAPSQSSQPQTGFALMRGPEYGVGAGWTKRPDPALDPTPTLRQAQMEYRGRSPCLEVNDVHGLRAYYLAHGNIAFFGPPLNNERPDRHGGTHQDFVKHILRWNATDGPAINGPPTP
jgi:hypothetical protein